MGSATGIPGVGARVAAKEGAMIRRIPPLQRNKEPCTHLVEVSLSSLHWPVDSQGHSNQRQVGGFSQMLFLCRFKFIVRAKIGSVPWLFF